MKNKKKISLFLLFISLSAILYMTREDQKKEKKVKKITSITKPQKSKIKNIYRKPSSKKTKRTKIKRLSFNQRNQEKSLKIYEKVRTYPPTTEPLSGTIKDDPLRVKYSSQETSSMGSKNSSLKIRMNKTQYNLKDDIILSVESFYSGKPTESRIKINQKDTVLREEVISNQGLKSLKLNSKDLGIGDHMIEIEAFIKDEKVYSTLGFSIQKRQAKWISSLESFIDSSGNLSFINEFHFYEPGNYTIKGILYDKDGNLIGSANSFLRDASKAMEVNLTFYGKLIYDSKQSGPYFLKTLEISKIDERLSSESSSYVELNQATTDYSYQSFTHESFYNEVIERKIASLKEQTK